VTILEGQGRGGEQRLQTAVKNWALDGSKILQRLSPEPALGAHKSFSTLL
jgi:hypothetical protein